MVISQWSCFLYIPDADRLSYTIPFPETNIVSWKSTPAKGDSYWKPSFFWGGYVSFREGIQSDLSRMSTHLSCFFRDGLASYASNRLASFFSSGMAGWPNEVWWWCGQQRLDGYEHDALLGAAVSFRAVGDDCCCSTRFDTNTCTKKKECMLSLPFLPTFALLFWYMWIYIYIHIFIMYIYKCTPCIHPMGFRLNHFELDTHFKAHFTL